MRYLAWATLVAATLLTILFDPRVFLGAGQGTGNWISFTPLFHGGSWWAFRLAVASLVLFAIAAATGSARIAWYGPALGALLVAWALWRGMPHADNMSSWARGDVGLAAWLRTARARKAREPRPTDARAFAGTWRSLDGSTWRFTAAGAEHAGGTSKCSGAYRAAYTERGRDVFAETGVEQFAPSATALAALPPNARLAVADVACSVEPWSATFVRVGDEVWLLETYMTNEAMKAGAFVLRRF